MHARKETMNTHNGFVPDTTEREKLAYMLMNLFDHWELDQADMLYLLGQSANSRTVLQQYRKQQKGLPKSRDTLDRASYLLAIHKALRLLYPKNPELRYRWIKLRNQAFDNHTPLEVMKEQGIIGLAKVARYLDFIRGH